MRIQYETHLKVEIFFFTPVCASLTWLSKLNGALIHNNPFFNFFLRKMSIAYNCIVFWGIIFMHKSHVIVINTSFAEVKYNASGKLKKKNQHFEIVFESCFFLNILKYLHPPCIFPLSFLTVRLQKELTGHKKQVLITWSDKGLFEVLIARTVGTK